MFLIVPLSKKLVCLSLKVRSHNVPLSKQVHEPTYKFETSLKNLLGHKEMSLGVSVIQKVLAAVPLSK